MKERNCENGYAAGSDYLQITENTSLPVAAAPRVSVKVPLLGAGPKAPLTLESVIAALLAGLNIHKLPVVDRVPLLCPLAIVREPLDAPRELSETCESLWLPLPSATITSPLVFDVSLVVTALFPVPLDASIDVFAKYGLSGPISGATPAPYSHTVPTVAVV